MDTFFIFAAKYLLVLPVVILGAYFLFARKWPAQKDMALFAVPAGLLAYALALIGRYLYYDPRPFVVDHFTPLVAHAADNGFPSDHTLLVATFAAVGMYWNKWLGVTLWIIALIVAIARVYVGVHHPIDVIGSIVIALVAVSVWHLIVKRIWKSPAAPEPAQVDNGTSI